MKMWERENAAKHSPAGRNCLAVKATIVINFANTCWQELVAAQRIGDRLKPFESTEAEAGREANSLEWHFENGAEAKRFRRSIGHEWFYRESP